MVRTLLLMLLLALPAQLGAGSYTVQPGDSLSAIAVREHVSLQTLMQANSIRNPNFVRAGMVLSLPSVAHRVTTTSAYLVRPGDTLLGLAATFGTTIGEIRLLNPRLGAYPLAGQWLRLCRSCAVTTSRFVAHAVNPATGGAVHTVALGETLSAIAQRFGTTVAAILANNRLLNANLIVAGTRLIVPRPVVPDDYSPVVRPLIVREAEWYGVAPSLALAIAWQESGFNQGLVSRTGAIGVMQVEPYTGAAVNRLLGHQLNLYSLYDNVQAGVFWLAHLLQYYGGNGRLAVAAYYQGSKALARRGFFADTVQYVSDVLALQARFAG